jgi:anti-sigma B factor antagonist
VPGTHSTDRLQRDPPARSDHGLAVTRAAMPGGVRVTLAGELDLSTVPSAVSALRHDHRHTGDLTLDLRAVEFIDAAGLAVVVEAARRARMAGRRFVVLVRSTGVRRLLALTRLDEALEIVVDEGTNGSGGLARRFGWDVIRNGSSARIALWGEIDLAARPEIEQVIDEVERSGAELVILDLQDVSFLDSNGLRLALELHAAAGSGGFALELVPGPPNVQRIFEITGTADILPFVPRGGA